MYSRPLQQSTSTLPLPCTPTSALPSRGPIPLRLPPRLPPKLLGRQSDPPYYHYKEDKTVCISPADIKEINFASSAVTTPASPPPPPPSSSSTDYQTKLLSAAARSDASLPLDRVAGPVPPPSTWGSSSASTPTATATSIAHGSIRKSRRNNSSGNTIRTVAEKNREAAKRLQNRESAKRFRRMQKLRWQNMKQDLANKDEEITQLKARISYFEHTLLRNNNNNMHHQKQEDDYYMNDKNDNHVDQALITLYSQLLSFTPNPHEGTCSSSYAALLGVHLRTVLCDANTGAILNTLKIGNHVMSSVTLSKLVSLSSGVLWKDVGDLIQIKTIQNALTDGKPVAIAYERTHNHRVVTVNAALAPVIGKEQMIVAEFVAPECLTT